MSSDPRPPVAKRVPHEITLHAETRIDPYFWLRDRDDPDTLRYLHAENAYLAEVMRHTEPLQEQLYAEMRGRIQETDHTVPSRRDDYFLYSRMEEGRQYPIFCRKHGDLDGPEEVLLDQNQLAEGHSYCRLGAFIVSPNHQLLAFSVDVSGSEQYELRVKDLSTGQMLPDRISNTYYGVEWANDNRTLFYTVLDAAMRPYKLMRHTLGTAPSEDVEVYHETDEAFFVSVSRTRSQAYLLLNLHSTTTTEVHALRTDTPAEPFAVVHPREHGLEYTVEHHGERFLIVTNADALNFKLVETPVDQPGKQHWRDLIPHRPEVLLDGIDAFAGHLAIYERRQGLRHIQITDPHGGNAHDVPFPEPVYTFKPGPNDEFTTNQLRFTYTSLVTPDSVVDYDMRTGAWEVRKQDQIPSGYDPSLYTSERLLATAPDGTRVPISLVYRAGLERDGHNPTLLRGYGAYGYSSDPVFSSAILSLLDRGFVFALAHIRGGSEMGRSWYEQGKLRHKKNTFTDFIACAEHLIAECYTSPEHLAILGGSAGGLLMGAVVNMRPDLFQAVIAKVPFVDVINTMSDPTLPLTVIEYEQWGNPENPDDYAYMRSYSPYDNVETKAYPHMLLTTGLNDPRVSFWEPAKWIARLRTCKTDDNLLLLKTNMDAGHGGASGRYDYLKEIALDYALLLHTLGVAAREDMS
jgi:oligopeptidase B